MALLAHVGGGSLLAVGGSLASGLNCCCGAATECCPEAIGKTLYLSITGFTMDGGATCDAACIPSITSAASFGTWAPGVTWLIAPAGEGTALLAQIGGCENGNPLHWDDDTGFVRDATPATVCVFTAGASGYDLIGHTCDPFYWEGDIPVEFFTPGLVSCGTGTIHVIITE